MPLAGHDREGSAGYHSGSRYFNPHAPCGARPRARPVRAARRRISIHMPLAGHDQCFPRTFLFHIHFNPHAPCGARLRKQETPSGGSYFNPHAPCGARRRRRRGRAKHRAISIHVPLAGHDMHVMFWHESMMIFQSTCPLRGTTPLCRPHPARGQ